MGVHASKHPCLMTRWNFNDYPWNGSTLQVIGSGKGTPLTRNGEGEEIVYSRLERECIGIDQVLWSCVHNKIQGMKDTLTQLKVK